MTSDKFNEIISEFKGKEMEIMESKNKEYSEGEDKLQNFREISEITGLSKSQICMNYLLKHIQSLAMSVRTGEYTWKWVKEDGSEGLKQRIVDARNYLLLLAACLEEEECYDRKI